MVGWKYNIQWTLTAKQPNAATERKYWNRIFNALQHPTRLQESHTKSNKWKSHILERWFSVQNVPLSHVAQAYKLLEAAKNSAGPNLSLGNFVW